MTRRSHAYLLGQQAHVDGDDESANPYDTGTNDFDDWLEGLTDARSDQLIEEDD